jgi:hypothetical protein
LFSLGLVVGWQAAVRDVNLMLIQRNDANDVGGRRRVA